jgi:DNA-binding winged helix-turn-helix (wHTH) protein
MVREGKELYEFGQFRLDVGEHLLLRQSGKRVPLSEKAFETLCVLVRNNGHLLSKEALLSAVWANSFVEENNLDKCIHALRRALGEKPGEQKFIETIRKHGYRFVAEVKRPGAAAVAARDQIFRAKNRRHPVVSSGPTDASAAGAVKPNLIASFCGRAARPNEAADESDCHQNSPPERGTLRAQLSAPAKRNRPLLVFALSLVFIVLVALVYASSYLPVSDDMTRTAALASASEPATFDGNDGRVAFSPDGRLDFFARRESDGKQSLWLRHEGRDVRVIAPSAVEFRSCRAGDGEASLSVGEPDGFLYRIAGDHSGDCPGRGE